MDKNTGNVIPLSLECKKLYENAVLPKYATDGAAALDCTAHSREYDRENDCWSYGLGFACQIPKGYVGLLFSRSSIYKHKLIQTNAVGVIDSDYRGEVTVKFYLYDNPKIYEIGERCCQLMIIPIPVVEVVEVNSLTPTKRGIGGHGSTGD